jgi:hypothetical protein
MKRVRIILSILILMLAAGSIAYYILDHPVGQGTGSIQVTAKGNVEKGMMSAVHKAADSFNDVMQENMGVRLHRDVHLFVAASSGDYESALQHEFDMQPEEAKEVANISGGWTGGKSRITVLNGAAGTMADKNLSMATTGHELFHQLQYELSNGHDTDAAAIFWLEEGSADYVGAFAAEKLGGQSLEKWQADRLHELQSVYQHIQPSELTHADGQKRKQVMGRKQHSYLIADLMVICLMEKQDRAQGLPELVAYFKAMGDGEDGNAAFVKAFGISEPDFQKEFSLWLAKQQEAQGKLEFISQPGVSPGLSTRLSQQAEKTRQCFRESFGADLKGKYQLILTADKDDFSQAITAALSETSAKADELSSNLWVESGSTILVNSSGFADDRQQQIFSMGAMLTRMLEGQAAAEHIMDIEWLGRGSAYYVATEMMVRAGYGTMPQYYTAWQQKLRKAGKKPALSQLRKTEDWNKAQTQYGQETVSDTMELATAYLVSRYGRASLYRWFCETGRQEDGVKAFQHVYGISLAQFEKEFAAYAPK